MFELQGGEWVAREVAQSVKSGRAKFVLHTEDLVWWGLQGSTPFDNPYWQLVNADVLKQLPAPDDQMRAAGLGGRVFAAVGNHEVWYDSNVEGLLSAFPYLKQLGVSDKQLITSLTTTAHVSSSSGPASTKRVSPRPGLPPGPRMKSR